MQKVSLEKRILYFWIAVVIERELTMFSCFYPHLSMAFLKIMRWENRVQVEQISQLCSILNSHGLHWKESDCSNATRVDMIPE